MRAMTIPTAKDRWHRNSHAQRLARRRQELLMADVLDGCLDALQDTPRDPGSLRERIAERTGDTDPLHYRFDCRVGNRPPAPNIQP